MAQIKTENEAILKFMRQALKEEATKANRMTQKKMISQEKLEDKEMARQKQHSIEVARMLQIKLDIEALIDSIREDRQLFRERRDAKIIRSDNSSFM